MWLPCPRYRQIGRHSSCPAPPIRGLYPFCPLFTQCLSRRPLSILLQHSLLSIKVESGFNILSQFQDEGCVSSCNAGVPLCRCCRHPPLSVVVSGSYPLCTCPLIPRGTILNISIYSYPYFSLCLALLEVGTIVDMNANP
jgi:hypothetical protein